MADELELELALVAASELRPGDLLVLPRVGVRRVLTIDEYLESTGRAPGPRLRIVVEGGSSESYEGVRSGHRGPRSRRVLEQTLRPFTPDEPVTVQRG